MSCLGSRHQTLSMTGWDKLSLACSDEEPVHASMEDEMLQMRFTDQGRERDGGSNY